MNNPIDNANTIDNILSTVNGFNSDNQFPSGIKLSVPNSSNGFNGGVIEFDNVDEVEDWLFDNVEDVEHVLETASVKVPHGWVRFSNDLQA